MQGCTIQSQGIGTEHCNSVPCRILHPQGPGRRSLENDPDGDFPMAVIPSRIIVIDASN